MSRNVGCDPERDCELLIKKYPLVECGEFTLRTAPAVWSIEATWARRCRDLCRSAREVGEKGAQSHGVTSEKDPPRADGCPTDPDAVSGGGGSSAQRGGPMGNRQGHQAP